MFGHKVTPETTLVATSEPLACKNLRRLILPLYPSPFFIVDYCFVGRLNRYFRSHQPSHRPVITNRHDNIKNLKTKKAPSTRKNVWMGLFCPVLLPTMLAERTQIKLKIYVFLQTLSRKKKCRFFRACQNGRHRPRPAALRGAETQVR